MHAYVYVIDYIYYYIYKYYICTFILLINSVIHIQVFMSQTKALLNGKGN